VKAPLLLPRRAPPLVERPPFDSDLFAGLIMARFDVRNIAVNSCNRPTTAVLTHRCFRNSDPREADGAPHQRFLPEVVGSIEMG
jgi:hypothetical protein